MAADTCRDEILIPFISYRTKPATQLPLSPKIRWELACLTQPVKFRLECYESLIDAVRAGAELFGESRATANTHLGCLCPQFVTKLPCLQTQGSQIPRLRGRDVFLTAERTSVKQYASTHV